MTVINKALPLNRRRWRESNPLITALQAVAFPIGNTVPTRTQPLSSVGFFHFTKNSRTLSVRQQSLI